MLIPKQHLVRDKAYLKWVRSKPCVITGRTGDDIDPAHIRYNLGGGMGLKPSDDRVVPLYNGLHRLQHSRSEISFWTKNMPDNPTFLMECLIAWAEKEYRLWSEDQ